MDYKLRKINKEDNYNELLLAYYNFFEQLNGKNLSSLHIKKELSIGRKIPRVYMFTDSNYNYAVKAVQGCEKVYHAIMIGAYDEHEGLCAVSRMRIVNDNGVPYACVAEIIPTNVNNRSIKTNVIDSFEHHFEQRGDIDTLSFEVPKKDTDFQTYLINNNYNFVPGEDAEPMLLFEKSLNRQLKRR